MEINFIAKPRRIFFLQVLMSFLVNCAGPEVTPSHKDLEKQNAPKPVEEVKLDPGPSLKLKNAPFVEVSKEMGLSDIKSVHNYIVDWNGDGVDDLVILSEYYGVPEFYSYDKKKKKFIKSDYNPFGKVIRTSFMGFADFDKDGVLDVLLATLNQKTELNKDPLRLYKGKKLKGKIKYILQPKAFPSQILPISSVGIFDFNLDGLLDLFIGNWYDLEKEGHKSAPDRLYQGQKKGLSFVDASAHLNDEHEFNDDLNIYSHAVPTYGVSVCDVDQNGYPDIATASSSGYSNRLWLNLTGASQDERIFKDYAEESKFAHDMEGAYSPLGGGNSFYSLCQDYNNDTIIDFAVGELFHSYDTEGRDRSSILTGMKANFPPEYLRTEYHMDDGTGSWNQGDRRAAWIDLNFDGLTDLLVENSGFPPKSRLVSFTQDESHSFADTSKDNGIDIMNPSGVVVADFNDDGRPDIVVGQVSIRNASLEPRLYLFENNITWQGKKVLKVILRGKEANYHGLGATVMVHTDKAQFTKVVSYLEGGLPSQNGEGLFFGMGEKEKIKSIEVRWPLLKKDRSGRTYPFRKIYKVKDFKKYKKMILTDS